ncbi:CocE/NonD family hydrolase [Halovenus marina]|uniref:CocE/NonD family hydrolase n=1 Tax=Halovenus marina TaxID=3396621 RepID=UPI003F5624EC
MTPSPLAQSDHLVRHDGLRIPVGDETVAASRIESTDAADREPVVLVYTPYRKDDRAYGLHYPGFHFLAERGYRVVLADMIGTGASTGVRAEPFTPEEGREGAAIVEWLADRDWSTGRVGMFGLSYPGLTALAAAAQQPDGLEAIVPIHAPNLDYHDMYEGGAFELFRMGGTWLPLMQALPALPPSRRDPEGRWARIWRTRLEGLRESEPWLHQYLEHDRRDDYWRSKEIPVSNIETPTLSVGGWRDEANTPTVIRCFERIDAPKRLLLGPWRHRMPPEGREHALGFYQQMRDWFDRFLKGEQNGIETGPEISYWTERDGGGKTEQGAWRTTDAWPRWDDDVEQLQFDLTSDGLLSGEWEDGSVAREYEYDQTVGMHAVDYGTPPLTNDDDARSMTFDSGPLDAPLELTGTGAVTLRIQPTTPDLVVAARVIDVSQDGAARLVTSGQGLASCRESVADPDPLEPGSEYEVTLPLKPKSHVFESGHRLRLSVSAADFPRVLPPPYQGSLTLRSTPADPSLLRFPGRRHSDPVEFADTVAMPSPTAGYEEPNRESSWSTSRDHLAETATVTSTEGYRLPFDHGEFELSGRTKTQVTSDDSLSVSLSRETTAEFDWGDSAVRVDVSNRIARHHAETSTTVTLDDQVVFDETWTWTRN